MERRIKYFIVWVNNNEINPNIKYSNSKLFLEYSFDKNLKNIQNNNSLFFAKTNKGLVYISIKGNLVNIAEGFTENMKDKLIKYFFKN